MGEKSSSEPAFSRALHSSGANMRAEFLSINLLSVDQDLALQSHAVTAYLLLHCAAREQTSCSYFLLLLPAWCR